ncbi:hypothetical protein Bpfe_020631 [Biomphalaria pfeifferi]|uniref:Uncharacterized protein n=1 Tax=Biomphalaria pfeifferi TaxID=112525 RepID=A0AAD8B9N2_BIOPF|nr:hypothetical protein Bpfe_020631 [Biomphalaria pfeifferi]
MEQAVMEAFKDQEKQSEKKRAYQGAQGRFAWGGGRSARWEKTKKERTGDTDREKLRDKESGKMVLRERK